MTNEQILCKAIEKAMKNGWQSDIDIDIDTKIQMLLQDETKNTCCIIYDKEFAKAFFGLTYYCNGFECGQQWDEPPTDHQCKDYDGKVHERFDGGWRRHLQNMVLEEDPLNYLSKFI